MRISDWSSDVCSSDLPAAGRTRVYATPPRERTRKITSSASVAEQEVNWMRHDRSACTTGPPSVSSKPWSTASRTSAELSMYSTGTNLLDEREIGRAHV